MLNSPTADQGGFCNLFSVVDLKHLANREPKLLQKTKEANDSINTVDAYLRAYGKFQPLELQRLVSTLEVRCIMHAFGKKAETRASYDNFTEIMRSVVDDAKKLDATLPELPALKLANAGAASKPAAASLRQMGKITNAMLESKGFKVDALISRGKHSMEEVIYKITKLNDDETTITVVKVDEEPKRETILKRSELSGWMVVPDNAPIFFTDIAALGDHKGLAKSIIEGAVKQVLPKESLSNSAEENSVVVFKDGHYNLHATKKFTEGKFCLYPVCNTVMVSDKKMEQPWINIGKFGQLFIYFKSSNSNLRGRASNKLRGVEEMVAKFWVAYAAASSDDRITNCELVDMEVDITVGKSKIPLTIPKLVNSVVIKDEDVIKVLTASSANKRPRKA